MKRELIAKLFGETWVDFMAPFLQSEEWTKITTALGAEKVKATEEKVNIFPDQKLLFRAFKELPLPQVRVVLLGMDPYPIEGYANGLAFAHSLGKKVSPSLLKVIDAIEKDCCDGLKLDKNTFDCELTDWVKQGVLLLNTSLTVIEKKPGTHADIWKPFTTYVVKKLNNTLNDRIFFAWGNQAQVFIENIHFVKHFTLTCEHPSAAAQAKREWLCTHFSSANAIIVGNQLGEPIKWMK